MRVNDKGQDRVAQAIRTAESNTSGEIVAILARESDSYRFIPTLWAALIALLLPAVFLLVAATMPAWTTYLLQLLVFLFLVAAFQIRPLHLWLVPRSVKKRRASRMAYLQFYSLGLNNTKARAAVLIFVSLAERHVEVLADVGISRVVQAAEWKAIVDELAVSVRAGDVITGYERAIKRVGDILAKHFPGGKESRHEIEDGLFVI